jgi:DNA-binding transcriptional ArsR family regulator
MPRIHRAAGSEQTEASSELAQRVARLESMVEALTHAQAASQAKPKPIADAPAVGAGDAEVSRGTGDAEVSRGAGDTAVARGAVQANAAHVPADERFWALSGLQARAKGDGEVVFAGTVVLPDGRQFIWQGGGALDALQTLDWAGLSAPIAALAHPVRLRILKALMQRHLSTQDLLALDGMGTTGQLFHHLKALQQAGWLRSTQRGVYELAGERIVPLLVVLSAVKG